MNPGELRQRITLQTLERTPDEGGGGVESWSDGARLWARVEPLEGSELIRAQQLQARVSHRVTIRYRPGLTPGTRFRLGGRVFDIRSVIDVEERHVEMQLLAEEVVV